MFTLILSLFTQGMLATTADTVNELTSSALSLLELIDAQGLQFVMVAVALFVFRKFTQSVKKSQK